MWSNQHSQFPVRNPQSGKTRIQVPRSPLTPTISAAPCRTSYLFQKGLIFSKKMKRWCQVAPSPTMWPCGFSPNRLWEDETWFWGVGRTIANLKTWNGETGEANRRAKTYKAFQPKCKIRGQWENGCSAFTASCQTSHRELKKQGVSFVAPAKQFQGSTAAIWQGPKMPFSSFKISHYFNHWCV